MVYLLFKGEGVAYNESNHSITIPSNEQVYAGQTINFRTRDSSRSGPMRNSDVKLCIAHELTVNQRDSLETLAILFSLFLTGLRCKNNSVYPVQVYLSITTSMTWEDTYAQNMLLQTNSWSWSAKVMVVATAPPHTLLSDSVYLASLAESVNPLLYYTE
jgi:hypothetical protein